MSTPAVSLERITKVFGATRAVDDVSIRINRNEVVGLIGENGSGKSTLLKILAGVHKPSAGTILRDGETLRINTVVDAAAASIGMVYQEQSLIPNISVAENLLLGNEGEAVRFGWYDWKRLNADAAGVLQQLDLDIDPRAATEDIPFAQRQMVEIAKLLVMERQGGRAPVMLFDEPTAVLEKKEVDTLFRQIRRLRQIGSVVFVSHRLHEVLEISDRIYVLKDGRCVGERDPRTCRAEELYEMMVGRPSGASYYREAEQVPFDAARVTLSLEGLSRQGHYRDIDLQVHAGEVLALTGLIGSGCEALCRSIFGIEPIDSGTMRLQGAPIRFNGPSQAIKRGIGYVPAERHSEGIVLGMSVAANMVLVASDAISIGPLLQSGLWRRTVAGWIERLRIRVPSATVDIAALSGGNQQKVVLAKWLLKQNLPLLLLDHPARGLDVGAKEDVYGLIRELSQQGLAVILLADTIDEAIALSHTVVVMHDGTISGRFPAPREAKPSEADIVKCMM